MKNVPHDRAKRVGIWIRVSTKEQIKDKNPEYHEQRARSYAEIKGWEVIEVYNLTGVNDNVGINHPTARKMLRDIEAGKITGLIFSRLPQLAHSLKELLEFIDHFREYNADFISLEEAIDTSSLSGRQFFHPHHPPSFNWW